MCSGRWLLLNPSSPPTQANIQKMEELSERVLIVSHIDRVRFGDYVLESYLNV